MSMTMVTLGSQVRERFPAESPSTKDTRAREEEKRDISNLARPESSDRKYVPLLLAEERTTESPR